MGQWISLSRHLAANKTEEWATSSEKVDYYFSSILDTSQLVLL